MVSTFPEKLTQPQHYPCLCDVTKNVLFWARLVGILPIKSLVNVKGDIRLCYFAPSKFWVAYSVVLQLSYFVYFCVVYGIQLSCSRNTSFDDIDWYLMTVGYFMSDLDAIVTMLVGSLTSKKICKTLEDLSKLNSSIVGMRNLHTRLNIIVRCILLYFTIMFSSFIYIAVALATQIIIEAEDDCGVIDSPFVITMRGLGKIIPTVQVTITCMFTLLIEEKFDYLADSVAITIENMSFVQQGRPYGIINKESTLLSDNLHMKINDKSQKMDDLAELHKQIFDIQNEINFSTGLQLLLGCCTSLYTIIYYLFRYITASTSHRSNNSRLHYVLSLIYRFAKILIYMFLGQRLSAKSMRPLEAVQHARSSNLPLHSQVQVQTLMLRWLGKRAYLSACGIVNFGPWLLAPIVGNVITYLLVALQFENIGVIDANVTTTIPSPL